MNMNEIVEDLNDYCEYRYEPGFNEWTEYDIDFENESYRKYCYHLQDDIKICNQCSTSLEKHKKAYMKTQIINMNNKIDSLLQSLKIIQEDIQKIKKHLNT